jgi:hypothetical protein
MNPMKSFFVLRTLVLLLILALSTPVLVLAGEAGEAREAKSERELPPALARHLEKLGKPVLGEAEDGRTSAAEAAFLQRAYPDDTLSVEQMDAARAAYAGQKNRPFPTGKGRPGTWVTVGPSEALYPFTPFRNAFGYVPNDYVAGGRTTALAISDDCTLGHCRLWAGPAGGGIWRTKNALSGQPHWEYLAGPFGINAVGSIAVDPNDPTGNTIYAGTGEANICGSGCVAGDGLYKSTDGGDTWTGPLGQAELGGKGIGTVIVKPGDPNTIYAATTTALRGMSSVCCGGGIRPVPGAARWGLYKSVDGGTSWTFIHNGAASAASCTGSLSELQNLGVCSPRGVRHVVLDPFDPEILYAGSYSRGVWRSNDGGATWTQIKASLNAAPVSTRPALAAAALPNGKTRLYVYEGNTGAPFARLFRTDDAATGAPVFTTLTSSSIASPGYGTFNLCTGQCSYDLFVHSPKGYPDMVYVGGSYSYNEPGTLSNGRAVVLSTDAGVTATDMTFDATDTLHPNGLHPDQHFLVTNPNNPFQFFESSDGGIMRSSGDFVDASAFCDSRGLTEPRLSRCKQLLSRIPSKLESMNKGLSTLQFQSLSVSPHNVNVVQGGTQDNGTWQSTGNPVKWENTMIGDGGQSGFDVADPDFRFHTFYDASPDVNFSKGDIADWNWISDPIFGTGAQFYAPIITDPVVSRTMFVGTANAWRTKTWGMGAMTVAEYRGHCNEWFGDFTVVCGDWEQIASPALNAAARGTRAGGSVVAIERAKGDTSTSWAATSTGRVFVSKNVDADPAGAVIWTRIDTASQPGRFVTGIYVDPANSNRAWISYSGFNVTTPATPGHVFEVVYNPGLGTAAWTDRSYDFGDLPVSDVVRDDVTGDLYVSSDFGVSRLASGTTSWTLAAPGMPSVEVAGLTMVSGERKMYAATHGLGAWLLNLP